MSWFKDYRRRVARGRTWWETPCEGWTRERTKWGFRMRQMAPALAGPELNAKMEAVFREVATAPKPKYIRNRRRWGFKMLGPVPTLTYQGTEIVFDGPFR